MTAPAGPAKNAEAHSKWRAVTEYGVALGATLIALLIRFALDPYLGDHFPHVTFFIAVAVTTWYAGLGPSFLALLLGGLLTDWFFIPPRGALYLADATHQVVFAGYFAVTLTFVGLGQTLRRARQNAEFTSKQLQIEGEDRRRVQEELRVSEQRLRLALEGADLGFWDVDVPTGQAIWNRRHAILLGYSPVEGPVTMDHWRQRIHPDDLPRIESAIEQAKRSRERFAEEHRIIIPETGEVGWLSLYGRFSYDEAGTPVRFSGVSMDITERKQAEEALAEGQRALKTVTDNASLAFLILDARQQCIFMNPAAEELTGYTLAETLGRPLHDVVHHTRPDGRSYPVTECPIDQAFPEQNRVQGEEIFVHKDGHFYTVAFTASPIKNTTGTPVGTIVEIQDITDRKQAEKALREAQEQLQRWNVELEQVVAVKTSELVQSQTRLRALASELNLAEQRERKRLAAELHDHLQQTLVLGKLKLGAGKRFAVGLPAVEKVMKETDEVFSDALMYTRTLVAELSPPVLRDHGLAAGLKWLAEHMKKHEQTVTVTLPEGMDLRLPDDQVALLFQSVRELLFNSSKHAGTGEAAIIMENQGGTLSITVSDQGKGFDPAAPADRPSGEISSKYGLFSIEERMRALGGSFIIRSAPGEGTKATLIVPLASKNEKSTPSPTMRGAVRPAGGKKSVSFTKGRAEVNVLLVDDHVMVREGLRSVLDAYEDLHVVAEAGDGAEAVKLVGDLHPRVVVMDINMPRMNGIEATRHIKTRWPETTVIGISINAGDDNSTAMKRAGAATVIPKDTAVDQLHDAIIQEVGISADRVTPPYESV
jgi:PAS domain S-box-containing protein